MPRFVDDDRGYLEWVQAHADDGYVLNCNRPALPSYLELHKASCHDITVLRRGAKHWTADYQKVCSTTIEDLGGWSRVEAGRAPDACLHCNPT
jgi:hypothetical protein